MRRIELLAPARNLETGRQAILHGADAVYIGGPGFGARQAAGNSLDDIRELCAFARPYGVRIYVTLNTIIYDHELREAESLAQSLYQCGASALIVQDLALLRMHTALPLHASTQMDNRTPEKARWLYNAGYEQAVLARELSLDEIRAIHDAEPRLALEAFVHGALCVSYSGRCQASQHCFRRSANRGECAQFCRLAFDLVDAEGQVLESDRHLLSLRDMNRSASLEEMIDAGISSFKIEGRLKDIAYVKNTTAYYRQALDRIIAHRPDLERSSQGEHHFCFTPQLNRSFNRGFTDYYLHGRQGDEASIHTPKSIGEPIGKITAIGRAEARGGEPYIDIALLPGISLSNGDGLCFFDSTHRLRGFRVNRAAGNRAYLNAQAGSLPFQALPEKVLRGLPLYRNQDCAFDALLAKPTAERRLPLDLVLTDDLLEQDYELARTPQEENIRRQMARLGDTPYYLRSLSILFSQNWFIPSSHLAALRRKLVEKAQSPSQSQPQVRQSQATLGAPPTTSLEMGGGIANRLAREVAEACGLSVAPSCEVQASSAEPLMVCRYCLRYELGQCPKQTGHAPTWKEPLQLRLPDGRRFPLKFDCQRCEMQVLQSC